MYDARENLIEEGRSDSADVGGTTWKILNKVMADCNNDDFSKITSCLGEFGVPTFGFLGSVYQ